MQKVLIIHGWGDNGNSHWIPWLKLELENRGYEVYNPDFPNPDRPLLKEWSEKLDSIIEEYDTNLSIVAYSSGSTFIFRHLSVLNCDWKLNKLVCVSPFDVPLNIGEIETRDLYQGRISWNKLKQNIGQRHLICSDNDKYIPLDIPKRIAKRLEAEILIVKRGGLLNEKSGYIHPHEILDLF